MARDVTFAVGVTRDMRGPDGGLGLPGASLAPLAADPAIRWSFLEDDGVELVPEDLADLDAVLVLGPRVSAASLEGVDRLCLVARHGVGVDSVDLAACRRSGVAVTTTPNGVRRPMAAAAVGLILALAFQLPAKDRLARRAGWPDRLAATGTGLTGRTVGLIGLGTIGRQIARLLAPFGCRIVATTPRLDAVRARAARVEAVSFEFLLGAADVVCVVCPLTPETHHLLDREALARMRPTAVLVNVARGAIVDQDALVDALADGRLAGAALDVVDPEPIQAGSPLLDLDTVLLAPHTAGASEELYRGCVEEACAAILAVASGEPPRTLVDPSVLDHPAFARRLRVQAGAAR